jgi:hypothetical protein
MKCRNLIVFILTACLLPLGIPGTLLAPDTASAGRSAQKPREGARSYVLESERRERRRVRRPRIPLPVGPSYIYYDYPYYYARGYYPRHIGGYVYYFPRRFARCSDRHRKCIAKSGYDRQRRSCRC